MLSIIIIFFSGDRCEIGYVCMYISNFFLHRNVNDLELLKLVATYTDLEVISNELY